MRQVLRFAKGCIGEKTFTITFGLIFIILGLAFLFSRIKGSSLNAKTFMFSVMLIAGIVLAYQMKIPEERIHILEYGILGWLAGRDLIKTGSKLKGIISACLFTIFIGYLDEMFQKVLPYRVFDVRDIVFNGLGGLWGVCLYILS